MYSLERDGEHQPQNGVHSSDFLPFFGDLDIKSDHCIPRCIIPNEKSYEAMVFGSIRTLKQRSDLVWVREDFL